MKRQIKGLKNALILLQKQKGYWQSDEAIWAIEQALELYNSL